LDIIPTLTEMKCDTENVFKSQDSFKDFLSPSFYFIFGYFLRKCIQTLCWLDKPFFLLRLNFVSISSRLNHARNVLNHASNMLIHASNVLSHASNVLKNASNMLKHITNV